MKSTRLFLVWLLSLALLANVLSSRATIAAFAPDFAICHSAQGGSVDLPAPGDAACRQHCMALATAMLAPEPPRYVMARTWRRAAQALPAPVRPSLAPRHADAQPRGPPVVGR